MHCQSICPVPFPSHLITTHTLTTATAANKSTDRTSSPRYKITPAIVYGCEHSAQPDCDATDNGSCHVVCELGSGRAGGGQAVSSNRCAFNGIK